jgi:hypothetical protein
MGVLIDNKHKIIFVVPHKGGQFTFSTWIKNATSTNGKIYNSDYYTKEVNQFDFTKNYDDYEKYLILRDPYKKFISGFLQECFSGYIKEYKDMDLTFFQYCNKILQHKIQNKDFIYKKFPLLKNGMMTFHLRSNFHELKDFIHKFKGNFNKVILTEESSKLLKELNIKHKVNAPIGAGNKKNYNDNIKYNIISQKICDIANGLPYPSYKKWYNKRIKKLVDIFYAEDFALFKRYKLKISDPFQLKMAEPVR